MAVEPWTAMKADYLSSSPCARADILTIQLSSPSHRESFYVTGTHLLDDGTVNPGWIARLSGFFFLELMPGGSQEGRRLEEGQGLCETSSEERLSQG